MRGSSGMTDYHRITQIMLHTHEAASQEFVGRHIGPSEAEQAEMLSVIGAESLDALIDEIVPSRIRNAAPLALDGPRSEADMLASLRAIAQKNAIYRNYIGQGYYGTLTPNVILRNILENPAWYTAYTPYQPEISQGRLEALLNFQTMVTDLTALDIANASLLDEGTAAAEAMTLARRSAKSKSDVFFVSVHCHPQTIEVVKTRAQGLDIKVLVADEAAGLPECFGVLLQYPHSLGGVSDYTQLAAEAHAAGAVVAVATDLLALAILKAPGEWGADIAVGSAQRFGVPLGFGGPHAGFMACRDAFKRSMPGRLVGVSKDAQGKPALRLALQTREQHIRREKATSNICTAQVLLAVMASMFAVYHGAKGVRRIAQRTYVTTTLLRTLLQSAGYEVQNETWFDTLLVQTNRGQALRAALDAAQINVRWVSETQFAVSMDETVTLADLQALANVLTEAAGAPAVDVAALNAGEDTFVPVALARQSAILSHPIFSSIHSETDMLRYLRGLADKDLALDRSMIPLGSCTMKLNATAEMIPITWPEFANIHPFAPAAQTTGYAELVSRLSAALCEITGYDSVSLQPNSGAQGEYAGLLAIRAYHQANGQNQRDVCLIPASAHGTNPASANLAGMSVTVVASDSNGNVDVEDLKRKIEQTGDRLAALMITYPSTHGVFEEAVVQICDLVHAAGGQVYLDGANMNAMVGLAKPGSFGSDVSHLNLHKTFCIPHGGGGPGVGPVAVRAHLAPYLPGVLNEQGKPDAADADGRPGPVSSAPFGSASILPISYAYIALMGASGLQRATEVALLNANYIATRLAPHYPVLYSGRNGRVAHECILDLRPIKDACGITVDDVAKRLVDYGFHAPTMSFPVAGTLMVEPTESESLKELDRFVEAMISIRREIAQVEAGEVDAQDNVLTNAPHTAQMLTADEWNHAYARSQAAYPGHVSPVGKYWPPVARVDNAFGDRNLVCSCPPLEAYMD
ncbi:glycine dehydrogenase (decarboxylating) alpha subunit /glycine dehydrogenase (decarboxylating) beta subunit [Advenella incenata]|uniref:Glycine dehydrogenase (decarboxylating) n=2 Tax=Advenella incenata TaxID=267800 RepID=A0A4Q7VEY0_9BURK|nr:glycine dehydrogenase (decarboxylating) alpha subunit /glycine dehydrogenase (decarboxylating) beta subunit [Advenella incenata]